MNSDAQVWSIEAYLCDTEAQCNDSAFLVSLWQKHTGAKQVVFIPFFLSPHSIIVWDATWIQGSNGNSAPTIRTVIDNQTPKRTTLFFSFLYPEVLLQSNGYEKTWDHMKLLFTSWRAKTDRQDSPKEVLHAHQHPCGVWL